MAGVRYKRYSPPEALWLPTTTALGNFFYFFGIWNNTCSPIALEGTHRDLIKGGQTTHSRPTFIKPYKTQLSQRFLDLLTPRGGGSRSAPKLFPSFLNSRREWFAQKWVLTFHRSEATLAPFVRVHPYENKAFLTNSVVPWPNGKLFDP